MTWDFYNESIRVELPPNTIDVEGWETLDPNNATQTKIIAIVSF